MEPGKWRPSVALVLSASLAVCLNDRTRCLASDMDMLVTLKETPLENAGFVTFKSKINRENIYQKYIW